MAERRDPLATMVTPPGGRVGGWFNVVLCGVLIVGLPIVAIVNLHPLLAGIVVAVVLFGIAVFMESRFVRILLRQYAAARQRSDEKRAADS